MGISAYLCVTHKEKNWTINLLLMKPYILWKLGHCHPGDWRSQDISSLGIEFGYLTTGPYLSVEKLYKMQEVFLISCNEFIMTVVISV